MLRHGLVESRIKYTNLRNIRQNSRYCIYTLQVSRIVERSQVVAGSEGGKHFRRQSYRLAEFSPPCTIRWPTALISSKDLMAPYSEFVKVFRINSTPTVCSGIFFSRIFFSPLGKVNFRKESFKPIFFNTTLGDNFLPVHIKQFVLDGRATAVQY